MVHAHTPVIALSDVPAAAQLIKVAQDAPDSVFNAADNGIPEMRRTAPGEKFLEAPTIGVGAARMS